jgi:hypothetical protein
MFASWSYKGGTITERSPHKFTATDWDNDEFINFPFSAVVTKKDGSTANKVFKTLRGAKTWISKEIQK